MRVLNVLYVTDRLARVGVHRGTLVVRSPTATQRIPIEALEAIVVFGGQLTSEALELCMACA